jgi:outer membrane protein
MSTSNTFSRARSFLLGSLLCAAAAGSTLLAPSEALAESKVAVVDMRRAVMDTEEGLRVSATLKKLFDNRQVDLETKQRQLQQDKESLEKAAKGGKTSQVELQKQYDELQKKANDLQVLALEYQREAQRKEAELTNPIVQRVLGIVKRIASQDGYDVVVDKSIAPYFRADLEITDKAIQMYNSGQAGGAPAPGGATPNPAPGKSTPPPAAPPPKKK